MSGYRIAGQQGQRDPNGLGASTPGAKLDADKLGADLLLDFARALEAVAQIADFGAQKYSRGGWLDVPDGQRRYTAALLRHLLTEAKGERRDPESRLLHSAHAAWNALARLELDLRDAGSARDVVLPRRVAAFLGRTNNPVSEVDPS